MKIELNTAPNHKSGETLLVHLDFEKLEVLLDQRYLA
jgi:hypothetical protein